MARLLQMNTSLTLHAVLSIAVVVGCEFAFAEERLGAEAMNRELLANPTDVGRSRIRSHSSARAAELLNESSDAELEELSAIALLAAWELQQRRTSSPASERAAWFLGFFEGRTRSKPNAAWRQDIHTLLGDHKHIANGDEQPEGRKDSLKIFETVLELEPGVDVSVENGRITFRQGMSTCSTKVETFAALGRGRGRLHFRLNAEWLIVVISDPTANRYQVLCFSAADGELKWRNTGWGNLTADSAGFRTANYLDRKVHLELGTETVKIFGSHGVPYFESFDLRSGDCSARFSACVWYGKRFREQQLPSGK
jgi:hypothetical protein